MRFLTVMTLFGSLSGLAHAASVECKNHGAALAVNNAQVIEWKSTTRNEYHDRGHITGTITNIYPNDTGHNHFEVTMDASSDTIEIVYDIKFGALPKLQEGDKVEACGDYITSNAPYQHYPVSPDGALIHWVHRAGSSSHDPGFVILNGTVYGD